MPEHFGRDCIYEEGKAILTCKMDTKSKLDKTIKLLKKEGYPEHNGLYENNFIYRKHNEKEIVGLMNQWWQFINKYSRRDQMSLCYLLWKNKVKSECFFNQGLSVRKHKDFQFIKRHKGSVHNVRGIKRNLIKILCLFVPVKLWRSKLRG